jgi:hypothetical protein
MFVILQDKVLCDEKVSELHFGSVFRLHGVG